MTDQNPFGVGVPKRQIAPPAELKAGLLVVPAPVPAEELQLHCQMYRDSARDFAGAYEILFEDCNEDGSFDENEWFNAPPGRVSQAQAWQKIMDWPRLPTFDEASQWQSAATVEAMNALTSRVMTFRANYAECMRLAEAGGVAFWRSRISLPPDRVGSVSIADIAGWLLEAAPVTLAAWVEQLQVVKD
jgi:hypothetical protein